MKIMKLFVFLSAVLISNIALSQVEVKASVVLNPAGDFVASLKSSTGQAIIDGKSIVIPNISIDLNTLSTGLSLRDDHAKNKYLEVKKFPMATLTDIKAESGKGTAVLQLKDKKKKVEGTYTLSNDQRVITAEFKINLSDFGIEDISYKGIGVDDEVKIEAKIIATKNQTINPKKK